jgi:succinoglycan biosynthesis transport protein ExoP
MNEPSVTRVRPRGGARDFLGVLFRRRWIITTVFIVTTVTVIGLNFAQPLLYESTGKVIVKRGVRDNLLQGGMRTLTWEEELASEVEVVKSTTILTRAQKLVDDERAARGANPLHIDAKNVDATVVGESNVLAMSYQSRSPAAAQEVTDAVIQSYMDYRKTAYVLQYPKEFFDSELARVSHELDDWTQRREAFMRSTQTVNLDVQGMQDADFVREQNLELAKEDQDLAQKRSALATMKAMMEAKDGGEMPFSTDAGGGSDFMVNETRRKLGEARTRLRSMEAIYVAGSAELVQQRAEVDNLEKELAAQIANRVALTQAQITNLEARREQVARSLAEGQGRLASYPERSARMLEFNTRIEALQKSYADLAQSAGQAKISKATSPDWTVALLTPASKAYAKNQRDYVRLALAPVFSLIIGLGLAFFIDGMDATLKNPQEAEEALDLPVLATLTEQKRRRA